MDHGCCLPPLLSPQVDTDGFALSVVLIKANAAKGRLSGCLRRCLERLPGNAILLLIMQHQARVIADGAWKAGYEHFRIWATWSCHCPFQTVSVTLPL